MAQQLTAEDAKRSLNEHVASKGAEIHLKYGPVIGWNELNALLQDRTCVRYPCEIVFDASQLQTGEFAHPVPVGQSPGEGFRMHVHPFFQQHLHLVPALVLYQLVLVNYGEFASEQDAEVFGAAALALTQEEYYKEICRLADWLAQMN